MANIESLLIKIDGDAKGLKNELAGAEKAVGALEKETVKANNASKALSGGVSGLTGVMTRNRAIMQQVGYQVGDFAVQVGSGTSAVIAFSQQGSQLLGVLGPYGAIAGAALAITLPLANALFRASGAAGDSGGAIKDLNDQLEESKSLLITSASDIKNLEGRYGTLTDRTKELISVQAEMSKLKLTEKMFEVFKDKGILDGVENLTWAVGKHNYKLAMMAQRLGITRKELDSLILAQKAMSEAKGIEGKAAAYKQLSDAVLSINTKNASREFLTLRGEVAKNSLTFLEYQHIVDGLTRIHTTLNNGIQGTTQTVDAYTTRLRALIDKLDPTSAKTRDYMQSVEDLDRAWIDGTISGERHDELIMKLATGTEHAAKVTKQLTDAQKIHNALMDEGKRLTESLRTPQQKYDDALFHYNDLMQEGAINWDTYNQAVKQAQDVLDQASKKGAETTNVWKDMGITATSALEDFIVKGGSARDMLKGLEQDLLRIFTRQKITEPLGNWFSSLIGGGKTGAAPSAAGGGLGSIFSSLASSIGSLFSFEGGGFTGIGPRTGGLDGRGGFMAMVHPNETVTDNTKGGGGNVTVIQNIYAQDSNSMHLSSRQIADDAKTQFARNFS